MSQQQQATVNEGAQVESFANVEPKGLDQAQEQSSGNDFESFDSMEVKTLDQEGKDAEEQEPTEEKRNPEVKRETDKLEVQEKDDEKESKSDEKPEKDDDGEEGDDKSDEEAKQDSEKDSGAKPKGKTIRLKNGDEAFDLDPNATVPVKVKGRKEFVTLQELRDNFSGHKAWTEEINTAKSKQAELEAQVEDFTAQKEQTKAHFAKIGNMLHDAFENPEADPLAAMKYLVDLSGRNVLDFEKRMLEHYGSLANNFSEMDEHQQQLYWTQRENEILKDNQTARQRQLEERRALEQRNQQLASVREQYGISEEDYSATEQELSQLGYDLKEVSPEQVSKYAALKPFVEKADELCSQFEEDLSDDEMDALITGTADTMFKFPELDQIEALRLSAKRLGFDLTAEEDLVNELERKTQEPKDRLDRSAAEAKKAVKAKEDAFESFDDFEELIYGR